VRLQSRWKAIGDVFQSGACLWKAPAPVARDPKRIALWTQVVTGMELNQSGTIRVLDGAAWRQRRLQLQELGGSPIKQE
jgi:hypothetical protein